MRLRIIPCLSLHEYNWKKNYLYNKSFKGKVSYSKNLPEPILPKLSLPCKEFLLNKYQWKKKDINILCFQYAVLPPKK